jgi:REP element-mobilizing transposase RayT
MPRIPRKLLIDPTEVGVFHCISRCVRRAFLCGDDRLSGKNFDHRKQWIQDRIEFLAGQLGIDVLGFSVMSNHIHVVLRNRPDVVREWSDEQVARRWWNVFPLRRDDDGRPAEPAEWELSMITGNPERLAEVRRRLSSISWFMRCVAEPIARWANREDACTGRFWEGRFKCQPILDESALAACLAYVDLNPIRAGIAETPETSLFTSVYQRISALRERTGEIAPRGAMPAALVLSSGAQERSFGSGSGLASDSEDDRRERNPDGWLSPFELSADEAQKPVPAARASNGGCLPMRFTEYLELLDWTGRQLRADKPGAIPSELAPILRAAANERRWLAAPGARLQPHVPSRRGSPGIAAPPRRQMGAAAHARDREQPVGLRLTGPGCRLSDRQIIFSSADPLRAARLSGCRFGRPGCLSARPAAPLERLGRPGPRRSRDRLEARRAFSHRPCLPLAPTQICRPLILQTRQALAFSAAARTIMGGPVSLFWDGAHATFIFEIDDPCDHSGTYLIQVSFYGTGASWGGGWCGAVSGAGGLVEVKVTPGVLSGIPTESCTPIAGDNNNAWAVLNWLATVAEMPPGGPCELILGRCSGPMPTINLPGAGHYETYYVWGTNCLSFQDEALCAYQQCGQNMPYAF